MRNINNKKKEGVDMSNNDNDFSNIFFQSVTPSSDGNNNPQNPEESGNNTVVQNESVNDSNLNFMNVNNSVVNNTTPDNPTNYNAGFSNTNPSENMNSMNSMNSMDSMNSVDSMNTSGNMNFTGDMNNTNNFNQSQFSQNPNNQNPYNPNMMNNQSVFNTNQPFNGMPQQPYKKTKKKAIFIPIAIACLVLAIAVVGLVFVLNRGKSDKKTLADNKSLFTGLFDFSNPISDELGLDSISDAICNGSSHTSGQYTIESLGDSADDSISGIGITYDLKRDAEAEKAGMDLGLTYGGKDVINGQLYMDKNTVKGKLPEISDKVYTVNLDTLEKDIKKSPLFKDEDLDALTTFKNFDMSQLLGKWASAENNCDLISIYVYAIKDAYPDDYKKIMNGITSKKTDDNGVTYTISEDSVKLFVDKLLTVSFDNDELNNYIDEYMQQLYSLKNTYSEEDDEKQSYDDFKKETLDSLQKTLKQAAAAFNLIYSGDLSFTVYKNDKGLLTGLKSSNELDFSGETIGIDFNITSDDELENPFDNMSFDLTISYEDTDFTLNYTHVASREDALNDYHELSCTADNETMKFIFSNTYDKESGELKSSTSISMDGEKLMSLDFMGSFTNVIKGKSLEMEINSLSLNVDNEDVFSLSGSCNVDTGSVDIKAPTGKECKILELSEDELKELGNEIEENASAFGESLEDAFSDTSLSGFGDSKLTNDFKKDLSDDSDYDFDDDSDYDFDDDSDSDQDFDFNLPSDDSDSQSSSGTMFPE